TVAAGTTINAVSRPGDMALAMTTSQWRRGVDRYVDGRQETRQHDGVEHQQERIVRREEEHRHDHDDEAARDDGVRVVPKILPTKKLPDHAPKRHHEEPERPRHDAAVRAVGTEKFERDLRRHQERESTNDEIRGEVDERQSL